MVRIQNNLWPQWIRTQKWIQLYQRYFRTRWKLSFTLAPQVPADGPICSCKSGGWTHPCIRRPVALHGFWNIMPPRKNGCGCCQSRNGQSASVRIRKYRASWAKRRSGNPATVASLLSVIDSLADFSSTGTSKKITFGARNKAKLSAAQLAQVTDKGWVLG